MFSLSLSLSLSLLIKVLSLLKDFQILIYVVIPELLRALRNIQVQLEKNGPMCNLKHHKVSWIYQSLKDSKKLLNVCST